MGSKLGLVIQYRSVFICYVSKNISATYIMIYGHSQDT